MSKVGAPFKDATDLPHRFLPELAIEVVKNFPDELVHAGGE